MKHPFNTPQMSQLKPLGPNLTQVVHGSGMIVLYSYETPVAIRHHDREWFTTHKWSKTTTKHIKSWICPDAQGVTQAELELILNFGGTALDNLH